MKFLTLLIFTSVSLFAENFKVAEHPAKLTRTITSFTEPSEFLNIEAEYSARLEKIFVNEGQELKGDQEKILVAKQDSKLIKIDLERAQAALKSENQILSKLDSEKHIAEREVKYRLLEK